MFILFYIVFQSLTVLHITYLVFPLLNVPFVDLTMCSPGPYSLLITIDYLVFPVTLWIYAAFSKVIYLKFVWVFTFNNL